MKGDGVKIDRGILDAARPWRVEGRSDGKGGRGMWVKCEWGLMFGRGGV